MGIMKNQEFLENNLGHYLLLTIRWLIYRFLVILDLLRIKKLRPYCSAIFEGKQMAILSDGTVVCSCFDYDKRHALGDFNESDLTQIWFGKGYCEFRDRMNSGYIPSLYCVRCSFFRSNWEGHREVKTPETVLIEYNANCNCHCPGCYRSQILSSRNGLKMNSQLYQKIVNDLAKTNTIKSIGFYNHGEPFLYPEAFDAIRRLRERMPQVWIFSTTNGIPLDTGEKRRALIESGLDSLIFSIDGTNSSSYSRYRRGGDFDKAIENLRATARLKRDLERQKPILAWRYLLFHWNDSDEEVEKAMRMAKEIGVDQFSFHITRSPVWAFSLKYLPFRRRYYERIKDYIYPNWLEINWD
jgi:MoaA/NifB/PqqE/SkfB family radical SAM enzyme